MKKKNPLYITILLLIVLGIVIVICSIQSSKNVITSSNILPTPTISTPPKSYIQTVDNKQQYTSSPRSISFYVSLPEGWTISRDDQNIDGNYFEISKGRRSKYPPTQRYHKGQIYT